MNNLSQLDLEALAVLERFISEVAMSLEDAIEKMDEETQEGFIKAMIDGSNMPDYHKNPMVLRAVFLRTIRIIATLQMESVNASDWMKEHGKKQLESIIEILPDGLNMIAFHQHGPEEVEKIEALDREAREKNLSEEEVVERIQEIMSDLKEGVEDNGDSPL